MFFFVYYDLFIYTDFVLILTCKNILIWLDEKIQ